MLSYGLKLLIVLLSFNICLFAQSSQKKVTLQLSWFDQFQFAGYYMAKEKGFYKEHDLDVDIKGFEFGLDIPKDVSNNKIDFAIGRETLILEKINNNNNIVVLYALFQSTPLALISKKSSKIKNIKDFKNKKIMTTIDDAGEVSLKAMISSSNVNLKDLKFLNHTHNIDDLINGRTDIISAYVSKAPFELQKRDILYNLFEPKEYGFDIYSDFLFTSEALIKKDIKSVRAFKEASLKGWEYAYENIEEAVDLILEKYNSQNLSREELLFEAKELKKLSYYQTQKLGDIKLSKLQRIHDLYKIMGLIKSNENSLDDFILKHNMPKFIFSKKEQEFISNKKQILFGTDKYWTPFVVENKDKGLSGFDKELIDLINQVSGTNIKLVTDDWKNIVDKFKEMQIDGLSTSVVHESRKASSAFTNPYFSIKKMIITTKENPKHIQSMKDLEGKTIAVLKHNLLDMKIAKTFKKTEILELDTSTDVIKALVFGEADAIISGTGTFYFADSIGLPYLKPVFLVDEEIDIVFTVNKEISELASIINKALEFIPNEKIEELKKKWFWDIDDVSFSKLDEEVLLSEKEIDYLVEKKAINICIYPTWLPYSTIDNFGNYRGINADIINHIASKMDINLLPVISKNEADALKKVENGICDLSALSLYYDDNRNLEFTSTYLEQPLVVATRSDEFFIINEKDIGNRKVGVVDNSTIYKVLKKNYPDMNLIEVKSASEGLNLVEKNVLFAYIDMPESIDYNLRKNTLYNLKISGKLDANISYAFAFSNDENVLRNIFEKLIKSISSETKEDILRSWLSVKFEKEVNYELIWQIVGSFVILIFILIIFFIKQNKLRKEIVDLNRTLEKRVREEVEKNREKDNALFRQSKLASMGEMIGNIAHQWRQPLNRINLSLSVISVLSERDELDKKIIAEKVESAEKNIKYMSETIEDFINFFRPDKKKTQFLITNTVERSLKLLEGRISDIKITTPKDKTIKIYGYENEFLQVLLIILNNAIDNFNITNVENKKIHISLVEYGTTVELSISDNSGGIAQEYLEKIFEPYFTTKFKKEGTGIGLYMAKMLVEKSMSGKLNVSSINESSTFVIKLNKFEGLENE